jgi:hypothetical protein
MAKRKRPYQSPQVTRYRSIKELPEKFQTIAKDILAEQPLLRAVIDEEQRCLSVTEELAHWLGYASRDLKNRPIHEITCPGTIDLAFVFRVLRRVREMQGLWVFEHKQGKKLLCSYRATHKQGTLVAEFTPLSLRLGCSGVSIGADERPTEPSAG